MERMWGNVRTEHSPPRVIYSKPRNPIWRSLHRAAPKLVYVAAALLTDGLHVLPRQVVELVDRELIGLQRRGKRTKNQN